MSVNTRLLTALGDACVIWWAALTHHFMWLIPSRAAFARLLSLIWCSKKRVNDNFTSCAVKMTGICKK